MRRLFVVTVIACLVLAGAAAAQRAPGTADWQRAFNVAPGDLASAGENPYFVLRPGYQLVLEGKEDGNAIRLVVSVLDETRIVGGIEARVVEERETENGALVEVSRNYFAIHTATKDVFYLGEDVDVYRDGQIVGHEGAWLHGVNGAALGLMMPGTPAVGQRYYQEVAPKVAMDRAAIVSVTERAVTPAGAFERCVRTEETTPLESGREHKVYAPGVGLVSDSGLLLTSVKKR